jgi:arabinose-5-phosphate isomerase
MQASQAYKQPNEQSSQIRETIIQVLTQEINSINNLINSFPEQNTQRLIEKILETRGKIIFSGLGKSGLVARKLAATFSSVGISSFFLHPGDALHGELGVIQPDDLIIIFSKSATGVEFEYIISFAQTQNNFTVIICCNEGELYSQANLVIKLPFDKEAGPLNLAPTNSSTLMMAFGDAIAIAISSLRGFNKNDFARIHPSGALGRRLTLTVQSFMHTGNNLPILSANTKFKDIIFTISSKKLGVGIIIDQQNNLLGIITDGDLRRACEFGPTVFDKNAEELMIKTPKTVSPDTLAYNALTIMEHFNITSLVVTQNQTVIGLVHIHDLIKAGIKG